MHVYTYIYISTHTHTHIYVCIYMSTHTHTHIYTYVCIYICPHTYIHICVCIYMLIHTHTHIEGLDLESILFLLSSYQSFAFFLWSFVFVLDIVYCIGLRTYLIPMLFRKHFGRLLNKIKSSEMCEELSIMIKTSPSQP